MGNLCREVMHQVNRLDAQHWLWVLVGMVFVGLFCLRGFGSRSDY